MEFILSDFNLKRRDPLLEKDTYKKKSENYFRLVVDDAEKKKVINDPSLDTTHRSRLSWSGVTKSFEHAILDYSGGESFEVVSNDMEISFGYFSEHKKLFPWKMLQYWEQDSYQYYLWLFSLLAMTGQPQKIPDLVRWYSPDPDGEGEDPLLGTLMSHLGIGIQNLPLAEELTFPKSYSALYEAIQGDETRPKEERQECLKRYLKHWYQGMKDCYWYGRHKGRFPTYFGYWAFEAGLVTLLYDLDDSSYRDMKYYPRDLVDHAREQGYDKLLDQPLMSGQKKHDIYRPGSHSPYVARWKSNLLDDEITLEKGQVLPGPERSEQNPSHLHFWISFRD